MSFAGSQYDFSDKLRAYETLHPGLYRYATPRQMNARFDALSSDFAAARTRAESLGLTPRPRSPA